MAGFAFSDHVRFRRLGALSAPPSPSLIPISKGLTRFLPIDPQPPLLQGKELYDSSPCDPHLA
jgi:hypothetical protein